jgi:hypothetical protein
VIALAPIVTLAALWLFGLGLALAIEARSGSRRRGALERTVFGGLLGLGLVPALWTAVVVIAGPQPPVVGRAFLGAVAALGALLAWRARATANDRDPEVIPAEPWTPLQGSLAATVLLFVGFAQFYAASMPMHLFDPLFHFSYKGRLIHHEGFSTPSWMVLPDELELHRAVGRPITHPNYPPGIPALHALVAGAQGEYDENRTRSLMGVYAALTSGLLWIALRPRGRTPALVGALAWSSLPLLFYSRLPHTYLSWSLEEPGFLASIRFEALELVRAVIALWTGGSDDPTAMTYGARRADGWTLDGAADLPLAALLAGAAWCLTRRLRGSNAASDSADSLIGGLLLGAAALAKNEGLALAALTLAVFGGADLARRALGTPHSGGAPRPWREGLIAAGAMVLVMLPWMWIRGRIPSIDEDYPRALLALVGLAEPPPGAGVTNQTPTDLSQALARVPVVLGGFLTSLLHLLRWNLTWIAFGAVVLWWSLRRPRALARHPASPLLALVLAALALYAVILVVTPWNLPSLYGTTIPGRLILHVAPLAILVTVALAWTTARERGE